MAHSRGVPYGSASVSMGSAPPRRNSFPSSTRPALYAVPSGLTVYAPPGTLPIRAHFDVTPFCRAFIRIGRFAARKLAKIK